MLRCSVKYSKPSDLAFPSVHRLSEHATAAQDDLHPAEKKTWPNTEHPWNGAIHKECLKKMRPTIFPCSCCCHNFKEPSKHTMVSPPLFWLQFQPTIKTKPQQKKMFWTPRVFSSERRLQISMLCHSSIINQTHFVICLSGVTTSANLIFQAAKSLRF